MNLSYHTWIANQSIISIQDIQTIKSIVGRYICKTYFLSQTGRELRQDLGMDEYYESAPQNVIGSDRVFVTPHIDGIFGILPFFRTWRCIYGLSDGHHVYTQLPFLYNNPLHIVNDSFYCFDYNRDIHWIYDDFPTLSHSRTILKLHFFEYPRALYWLSPIYLFLNTRYNQLARSYFLLSQQPYYNDEAYLWSCIINTITQSVGMIELYVGFVNLGILSLLLYRARSIKECIVHVSVCYWIQVIWRNALTDWTPALLNRDTSVYLSTLLLLYGYQYSKSVNTSTVNKSIVYNLLGPFVVKMWLPAVSLTATHYYEMYTTFQTYHTTVYNVVGHIVTTTIAYVCALGIGNPYGYRYTRLLGYAWFLSRYSIPEQEMRVLSVLCIVVCNRWLRHWGHFYSRMDFLGMLLLSIYAQELCHEYSRESTFMSHYMNKDTNVSFFIEHSIWLLPFELRALNHFWSK